MEQIIPLQKTIQASHQGWLRQIFLDQQIEIVSTRFFHNTAPWQLAPRVCPDSFLLFPTRGRVRAKVGKWTRELSPGEFLMLADGQWHSLEIGTRVRVLEQVSIHCHILDPWNRPFLRRFQNPFGKLPDRKAYLNRLLEFGGCLADNPALGQAMGEAFVRDLLTERCRNATDFIPSTSQVDPRIARAITELRNRFAESDFSISSLAASAEISETRFRSLFRQVTRTSPKAYLDQLRLQHAARRLRHSTSSVKSIASMSGFSSDHYFHRVFKIAFACTPSQYRQGSPI